VHAQKNISYFWCMLSLLLALQLQSSDSLITNRGAELQKLWLSSAYQQKSSGSNPNGKGAERFTVQVYAGHRSDASNVYARLIDSVGSEIPVILYFDEPQFKVFVGVFGSRIQAEHALRKWRPHYPTAFAVQAPNQRFKKGSRIR
jgi:hypothetical protein